MTDHAEMDGPKVREVVFSKPTSVKAAHELMSRFLETERQEMIAEVNGDELLLRLEHVCSSLKEQASSDDKKARKAAKKSAKKERKEKRKREKKSESKKKKKIKTSGEEKEEGSGGI